MILVGTKLKISGRIEADIDADRIAYIGLAECGGRTIGTRDIDGRGQQIGLTKEAYDTLVDCILYDLETQQQGGAQ